MISSLKPVLMRLRPDADGASRLPPGFLRSMIPLVMLAVGITVMVTLFLWREQAGYKPVFGARERVEVGEMVAALEAAGISYRIHPDSGQVLVPESRLGQARMMLAAKGVVAKLPAGLELMDRNDPLGVSQFVQDVRFRRGLEGELAQSIRTLDAVDGARVHLAIARSSSFVVSGGEKSSASVVLTLKPGRTLETEQVAAIIKLVANSAAGLEPARVSVVDQAGNLHSARVDPADGFEAYQGGDAARRHQDEVRRSVQALLAPVLGADNFKVSVTAEVDNDRVVETYERYGQEPRVSSEAMREESGRDPLAVGVPGSLSNRPVDVAPREDNELATTAQRHATSRQYLYDRTVTQVQRGRGKLRKQHVAVVLNTAVAPGGEGVWSADSLADIERLLRGGLGVDTERGDTLVVSAFAFPDRPEPLPWWQERDTILDGAYYLAYGLGLLFAYLLLVRPLLRLGHRLATPPFQTYPAAPGSADSVPELVTGPAGADTVALAAPAKGAEAGHAVTPLLEDYDLPPAGSPVDVMIDHLKVLSAKEPERVAEVVKQWVQKKNGQGE